MSAWTLPGINLKETPRNAMLPPKAFVIFDISMRSGMSGFRHWEGGEDGKLPPSLRIHFFP
jgi:hypothetical protein